ncbi:TetR family transcriptional regulator [Actinobacteria bacterium YIM 96077]|uniref:TetR family transcriptional regulator n=1 Tax=Phytoactinopolyspora halophila TaxID=1981511 RepID=A0A329QRP3_9ACTN|nr:TetR family transcriptional regulator [Phytoactinopolyspora halophila]AYY15613.1 TetR family transcriptional regulator [Actinobacteria bacterium YIM 96077]RAW14883.1 TetR family transcriptional regulator [Phytoactinopolyspora halophila]
MTASGDTHAGGLRERKKARTRAAIQDHALRLYLEQGYAATTIEQIAEAAEVSQSTFFRYFSTKAETVLYDRLDPVLMDSLLNQPAELSPLAAVRAAIHQVLDQLKPDELELEQTRWRLVAQEPELRSALTDHIAQPTALLTETIAQRVGREPDDIAIVIWAGGLIGAIYAAFFAALQDPDADLIEYIDGAIARLEAGLPL